MANAVLEPSEFLYLLSTLAATSILGFDNERVFPVDGEERQSRLGEGFRKLQEHGWLRPADQPGQLNLDDALILMVAVVANPEAVILTSRNTSATGRELLSHYLAVQTIVEMSVTAEEKIRLGVVPDLASTVNRIQQGLGLGEGGSTAHFQITLEEETLNQVQQLAATGQSEQAAAILNRVGLSAEGVSSLCAALESTTSGGNVAVLSQRGGQVLAGQAVMILQSPKAAWIARRSSPKGSMIEVSTLEAGRILRFVEGFLKSLA